MDMYTVYPEPMWIFVSFIGVIGAMAGRIVFLIASSIQLILNIVIAYFFTMFIYNMWFGEGIYLIINEVNVSVLIYLGISIIGVYVIPFLVIGGIMLLIASILNLKDNSF